jgi:Ferritin-like
MSKATPIKRIARNAPALRKTSVPNPTPRLVAGNPISTRLESGIGNCFPGLECDLRNLERRFFPFLEMDMPDATIDLVQVDLEGVMVAKADRAIDNATFQAYQTLAAGGQWTVDALRGTFGPLGNLTLKISTLPATSSGDGRLPPDPWTAVRLLTEGTEVRLTLVRVDSAGRRAAPVRLTGKRARYLGDDGALAPMFAPGELTQSLCSPWTHDFRDCACFYWASNHPDIALPPLPSGPTDDPKWDVAVAWERRARTLGKVPAPATAADPTPIELRHYEINRRWQALNFVIERREQIGPYAQRKFTGKPLRDEAELEQHLRYVAGVELGVLQEYVAAAYSLKSPMDLRGRLRDDVRAAHAEIMRIALGEMRHLRAVNMVIAGLLGRPRYKPALGVATVLPGTMPQQKAIRVQATPLTREAVKAFIAIEAPSQSVDGLYGGILATLEQGKSDELVQAVRTIMAEGEDHYRTFLDIQEWLAPHDEREYLRAPNLKPPPAGNSAHQALQERYRETLNLLYDGYQAGMPDGAAMLNRARNAMIEANGIADAAEAVAKANFLVVFDTPIGRRFAPISPP